MSAFIVFLKIKDAEKSYFIKELFSFSDAAAAFQMQEYMLSQCE